MRKIRYLFLCLAVILAFGGCSTSKANESEKILNAVLASEKTFIAETGKAVYLNGYHINDGNTVDPILADPAEYTFVDFDADGNNELVVNISPEYGCYLVFHYNGQDVFGYEFGVRALQALKSDGTFMGSNGAASNYYCQLSFEENQRNITYTAVKDSTLNRFELNGKECSIEELNEYINDWNLKEPVKWIECKKTETDTPNDTTVNEDSNDEPTSGSNAAKINLNNYVSVEFDGNNLAGYGSVRIDKEKFLLDHIGNISFNQENIQVYRELYGNTDTSAANAILKYISVKLTQSNKLSNGDTVEIVWNLDTEKIETYFIWEYTCSAQSYTVEGLKDAETFDPFENIEVTFSGTAPYAEASVYGYGSNYGGTYTAKPSSNLKNGDTVTVTYTCEDKATMIAQYGKYPASYEKAYTVSGLTTYVQSMSEISTADFDTLLENAVEKIWVIGYGNYKEAKYCGYYFYTAKNQPAHGVHFLQWCGMPVGNAVCFVFEHPSDFYAQEAAGTAYTVIALENLTLDENGTLVYKKHEMWQMSQTYDSSSALTDAFVGVFDEIMNCTSNVNFE